MRVRKVRTWFPLLFMFAAGGSLVGWAYTDEGWGGTIPALILFALAVAVTLRWL